MIVFECDETWAAASYITTQNDYWGVFLKADGINWILQDTDAVCSGGAGRPAWTDLYCQSSKSPGSAEF